MAHISLQYSVKARLIFTGTKTRIPNSHYIPLLAISPNKVYVHVQYNTNQMVICFGHLNMAEMYQITWL